MKALAHRKHSTNISHNDCENDNLLNFMCVSPHMSGFSLTVHSYLRFRPHHPQMSAVSGGEAQEGVRRCQVVSLTAVYQKFYSS